MRLLVNGESLERTPGTVAGLLAELGFTGAAIATALNGEFLPAAERPQRQLQDGDRLEVLAPMQGG